MLNKAFRRAANEAIIKRRVPHVAHNKQVEFPYRLAHELGWTADHVVITNGEAGYRYAALAETVYGVGLTGENQGRSRLPAIRKRETLAAGKVLGIPATTSSTSAIPASPGRGGCPNQQLESLRRPLVPQRPAAPRALRRSLHAVAHGRNPWTPPRRHPARTGSRSDLPEDHRPLLLAADPCAATAPTETLRAACPANRSPAPGTNLASRFRLTATPASVPQRAQLPNRRQLVYRRTKSQGLFQTDSGKHQLEQFWLFEASGRDADSRARALAAH